MGYSIHPSEVKNGFSEGCPKGEARGDSQSKTFFIEFGWIEYHSY